METIRNVDVNRLHDFKNHPFKVEMNTELCELMRSIEKEGVLVPLLVRTNPYGDGYEVISGHRRKEAAIWAGETKVPVVIRELDDDQAVVAMVDSNLHRENLKPSEKAFAYKMKLNAMKHQGKHLDSGALAQVGPKFTDGSQLNENCYWGCTILYGAKAQSRNGCLCNDFFRGIPEGCSGLKRSNAAVDESG